MGRDEAAEEGRPDGVFRAKALRNRHSRGSDGLPRRQAASGVQRRDEVQRALRRSGKAVTPSENFSTCDNRCERALLTHLSLRERLSAR